MKTLTRIVKYGFKNFYRNGLLSASSVLIIMITLMIGSIVYIGGNMLNATIKQVEKKVDVTIYLEQDASENDIMALKQDLEKLEELKGGEVTYQTKEEVKKDFESHGQKEETIEALKMTGGNPFGAVLNITASSVENYKKIDDYVFSSQMKAKYGDIIESSTYKDIEDAVEKLKLLIKSFNKWGIIFSIVLSVIALIVTFNTLRLVLFSKKEEIGVMKLVGSSNFFAKGPFIFSGILYGLTAGILTVIALTFGIDYVSEGLHEIFILDVSEFYNNNIFNIAGSIILTGVLIGFVASYIAVLRYVRV